MLTLCRCLGITRQAYYQHFQQQTTLLLEEYLVIQEVLRIRQTQPVIGARKLYVLLQGFLLEHQIKMGRDALFDLLAREKLLVRKHKRRIHTTQSYHRFKKYPDLRKDLRLEQINTLWVADITYLPTEQGFLYLSLISDAYSHLILGWAVAPSLETIHTLQALEMALTSLQVKIIPTLIHHSDRGVQYCSEAYVEKLLSHHIQISMTQDSNPTDNGIAERLNGILKQEFLTHYQLQNQAQVEQVIRQVVVIYNQQRPHLSCGMCTPAQVHQHNLKVENLWKKKAFVNQEQD